MMRFQRRNCADEGMWMETQAQEQSYAFHEESWSSDNNCHNKQMKQFPGMHMNKLGNKFGGNHSMYHSDMHRDHGLDYAHGGGRKYPFGGKFHSGGHHEYFSREDEYEEAYAEEHVVTSVDEMRYEHHNNYQGGNTCYVNPYERNRIKNMNHKFDWTAKGV